MYDSIIIGSSAAGISAAVYLKRRGINFLLLGKDIGGEMALSGIVENYPGISYATGIELVKKFQEHLEKYNIEPRIAAVNEIKKLNDYFSVKLGNNEEKTKSIIIATGSKPKKLNVPGEKEFYRKGVSYCSVCDGPLFKEKPVAIIGGANSALESALMMTGLSTKVFILTINNELRGDEILINEIKKKENIEIITQSFTQEIFGDNFVKGLKYLDKKDNKIKAVSVEGIFIHIGMEPNTDFAPNEWKIKNQFGEIIIDKLCKTLIPGIFAAGDCTDIPYKQIGIATGLGIIAALSAVSYLNSSAKYE